MVAPLAGILGRDARVLVGPETSDDAGVFLHEGVGLVATADFITPVCDDPRRFGRVAAANSLSDVYAMGGRPLFALNLCCFPQAGVPIEALSAILAGAAATLLEAKAALLGGHSVRDPELKFGLAVVGVADPGRLLTNATAAPGDRLLLTKPLGTGVLINAFKADKIDAAALEPAMVEMERLNDVACALALAHGVRAATDITGFGLAGHALEVARASSVALRLELTALPVHDGFYPLVERGVTTGCTGGNARHAAPSIDDRAGLSDGERELLHDPQTSGGLLLSVPAGNATALLQALRGSGHRAAAIGEVLAGPPRLEVVR
jgi:selenide, water dikinase